MTYDATNHPNFEQHARNEAIQMCLYENRDFEKLPGIEQADWLERARQKLRKYLADLAASDAKHERDRTTMPQANTPNSTPS